MRKGQTLIVLLVVLAVISTGGYLFYLNQIVPDSSSPVYSMINPNKSNTTSVSDNSCQKFSQKFGTSSTELVSFINNEPDSATVVKGYRYLFGKITGYIPNDYFPLFIEIDSTGKIIKFECSESKIQKDYSKDIDFTIPESDLAQIIRYRESLETDQTITYLQNLKTTPDEAKNIFIERISSL